VSQFVIPDFRLFHLKSISDNKKTFLLLIDITHLGNNKTIFLKNMAISGIQLNFTCYKTLLFFEFVTLQQKLF